MTKKGLFLLVVFMLAIVIAGCTQAVAIPPVQPQTLLTTAPASGQAEPVKTNPIEPVKLTMENSENTVIKIVKVGDILNDPKTFQGKRVMVEGKIVSECGSGCWFTLKDGNAVIYIDLAPNNMVIPQKKGSSARVTAVVEYVGSDVYLIGSKVEF